MRRWLVALIALLEVCVLLVAVYSEPIGGVRGKLRGAAFYQGKPASYWADEIQGWQWAGGRASGIYSFDGVTWYRWQGRSRWLAFIQSRLPRDSDHEWPKLFDGDPDGLPVLLELSQHPSEEVRDWADIGMERIHNDERGPRKHPLRWIQRLRSKP